MKKKKVIMFVLLLFAIMVTSIHIGFDEAFAMNTECNGEIVSVGVSPIEYVLTKTVPVGIEVDTHSLKESYRRDEIVATEEIDVFLVYSKGEKELVDAQISSVDTTTCGKKTIEIVFGDYKKSIDVEVTYTVEDVEHKTKYAAKDMELYDGPGSEFPVNKTVEKYTELIMTGVADNGWARVTLEDKALFCPVEILDSRNKKYDNIIIGEKGTTQSIVDLANELWNETVPFWVKKKFAESDWNFKISAQGLRYRYGYPMSIAGVTDFGKHVIFLDNRVNPVKNSMLHELGHFVDYSNGWASDSAEFRKIFNKEKYTYVDCTSVGDGHETSSAKEYFASVFQSILIDEENCKKTAPKSYEFICRYFE